MSEAEGLQESLQESLKEVLRQQTAEFQKLVDTANQHMVKEMERFSQLIEGAMDSKPAQPKYEAKIIDGGLWLNKEATDVLLQVLDGMSTLLAEIEKGK